MRSGYLVKGIAVVGIIDIVGLQEKEFANAAVTAEGEGGSIGLPRLQDDSRIIDSF